MFVRQLKYLAALAREEHFARAAAICHVSQPALSAGIRKLEEELGVPIVMRGHRFLGLTPEGERVLSWARRLIADYDGMKQDLASFRGALTGTLRLGVIPATLPSVSLLTAPFCAKHPLVTVQVRAMNSAAIQRGLDEFELDAGLTYLDNEPLTGVERLVLYHERYYFVTAAAGPLGNRNEMSWAEAATRPLCLLTTDMQNRRIIDRVFEAVGVVPVPKVETNSFVSMCSHVRHGEWSAILPHTYFYVFGDVAGLRAMPLVEPEHSQAIGLAIAERDPPPPMARALIRCARHLDIESELQAAVQPALPEPARSQTRSMLSIDRSVLSI